MIATQAAPTSFHPGDGSDFYEILAMNDGAAATEGSTTVSDTLPAGVTVTAAKAFVEVVGVSDTSSHPFELGCGQTSEGVTVTVTCTAESSVPVGRAAVVKINIQIPPEASGRLGNTATVSGGGAPDASVASATEVTEPTEPIPFGASLTSEITGANGDYTQAGGHPFAFTTLLRFNVGSVSAGEECNEIPICAAINAQAKDIETIVPPGLVGNPTAVPYCTQDQFEKGGNFTCPPQSQVGALYLYFYGSGTGVQYAPVYNIEPPPGEPAELGFTVAGAAHIPLFFHLRSDGDYGLTADLRDINQFDPVRIARLSIWGEPTDEAHDPLRLSDFGNCGLGSGGCASGVFPPKPFLRLPTSCSGRSLPMSVRGDSWQEPFPRPLPQLSEASLSANTGCGALHFAPTFSASPTVHAADSPTGLGVDLHIPQPESLEGLAEADLKDAVVSLPPGLVVNPSSANGLASCSSAEIELRGPGSAACPDASRIGTLEVDTPLLEHPLPGSVFLAAQGDNPFHSLLAIYLVVNDPRSGVLIKLAGQVEPDPQSGQLRATFSENPQLPFEDFKLDFFGGPGAPLTSPSTCGSYKTTTDLTPWSAPEGKDAAPANFFQVTSGPGGSPCASSEAELANAPAFEAGTAVPIAGSYNPFVLKLSRENGSQRISSIETTLPPGLLGKLAGIPYCSSAAISSASAMGGNAEKAGPSCPLASEVGTVNVGAGSGTPIHVQGHAYLSGPYKGAPLSLAIITPALAGPFDLGTVVVRTALYVNPETAQVHAVSDPIPTILAGIPLDIRQVALNMNRPSFTLNPTSCDPMKVLGASTSTLGNVATLSSPFQVGACNALPFRPKLAIRLKGKTKRAGHPALRAALTMPPGGANIASAQVTLPHSEFLDQAHIGTVCTRVQFAAGAGNGEQCPAVSIYGHARAITPLLDNPIEGPVYLRSSSHKLPDLIAALGGQISVDLAGKVDTGKGGGIRNTFEVVPDAPVSKFVLSLKGGDKGLLVNSENVCRKPQHAIADFTAQNGKVSDTTPLISNDCAGKGKKKGSGHH